MKKLVIKGRIISEGFVEGFALVSKQNFSFSHGIDPYTGNICDKLHDWIGENINDKILFFPFGKGSLAGGLWLLEAVRLGNIPKAIINLEMDPIIASGIILADLLYNIKIVALDRLGENMFDLIETGNFVRIETLEEKINICFKND